MSILTKLTIDQSWTLFLDRDGVINEKLENDYVKRLDEFHFLPAAKEAIVNLNQLFGTTVVVTNQQGIGKGLMTASDLKMVHQYMLNEVAAEGGKIDEVYFAPELAASNSTNRKPNTGMAEQARKDFPQIDFKKSVMVGDSLSDMQMGKRVGMITVYITQSSEKLKEADFQFESLKAFADALTAS
jgi:D-glycero-D-manno-heptose 1,7-bisphosphate phosphatase